MTDNKITKTEEGLTRLEQAFVAEYIKDFNGTRASQRAGFNRTSISSFGECGSRLLRKSKIKDAVDKVLEEKALAGKAILARLAEQALGNVSDFLIFTEDPMSQGSYDMDIDLDALQERGHLIQEISWTQHGPKIKLYSAQKALVQIGKAYGLFDEKVKIEIEGAIQVIGGIDLNEDI